MDIQFPEWARVKCAALLGFGLPAFNSILVNMTPWLDALIKIGQVGVATATILYILAKWNKTRKSNNSEADKDDGDET
jgi:hypothetical protein